MGALVESLKWKKPRDDVLYGHECENDVGGFVGYCRAAGVPDSGIPERLDAAIRRGLEYLVDPRVCAAVEELADHLYEHGTTEGKKAVEIIGRAMMK